uniref:SGNH hydrolase-type esterase domain-containing protein n=1 Tax=Cyprinus carpio TaxID=7962 RepID=A0A8C1XXZ2_CYPCA
MADVCLPLSAGDDTFELHSVQLELEAMEKQIRVLEVPPPPPRVFLCTGPVHPGRDLHPQRRTRARPRATTSPPPVFEISTQNRFTPLRKTERDAVIVGDSIVRHVRATLAEGKVHTHCFPGACVLDVSAQKPAILKADESPRGVVLHAGVNDTTQRQTETLKKDFRSLIETVRSTKPDNYAKNINIYFWPYNRDLIFLFSTSYIYLQ